MRNKVVEFNVEVNDIITPSSCSSMVVDFIKCIIYQKQIIPYDYQRLKMYVPKGKTLVDTMKESDYSERNLKSKHFIVLDKYFKKTQEAYNSLENIFQVINEELTSTAYNAVEEIAVLLGPSVLNPQEVFRIRIPSLNYSHLDKHHSTRKNSRNLFRSIINCEKFYDLLSSTSCTTTLHVMLKMKSEHPVDSNSFILRNGFRLPTRGNQALITFKESCDKPPCLCFEMKIFEDDSTSNSLPLSQSSDCSGTTNDFFRSETNDTNSNSEWYQLKDTLKYFTDVKIDGTSVTDIWMNPTLLNGAS